VEVKAIKRRFLALNADRIERTRNALREHQRDVLDLLPLFFHVNHPLLPGFIAKDTPFGIADYSPSKAVKEAAIRLSKSFEYKRRPLMRYDISSVFLMGSSGTVAYSDKSDFDVWVCYSPSLEKKPLLELSKKAKAIEQWADGIGIEINIYLMNPERFRAGEISDLSGESSGSAQYHLLLDEFYRTSVLLAGCYPLWWLVPPEEEDNYEAVAHKLKHNRFIKDGECVDFGGLASIPIEEFFGASLWQLFKAIDSPYKSVLKLMLMEVYAHERRSGDLLSQRYKRAVYEGNSDLTELDPYVMLYKKLDEYLQMFGDDSRIDLLRRCFYFKVNLNVSEYARLRNRNWRWHYMRDAVKNWGWDDNYLNILDSRSQWKIHRVTDERKILVDELTHCYRFLSDFVRENEVLANIEQQDMNLLGRKLFATFERKAGKVEVINRGISGNLWESRLSLHCALNKPGSKSSSPVWALYPGTVDVAQAVAMAPLKSTSNVLEIIAWAYFNKVLDSHSGVSIYPGESKFTSRELQAVVDCISNAFPDTTLGSQRTEDYANNARVVNAIAIVNMGLDPMTKISGEGRQLMSNQTDALSYSGMHYNLINTIDMLLATSWGEVITQHYSGNSAILDCLCEYSRLTVPGAVNATLPFTSRSFSSARGMMIGLRIEFLFKDIMRCFYTRLDTAECQYILAVSDKYYALSKQDGVLGYQCLGDYSGVLEHLTKVPLAFVETVIDCYTLQDTVLPLIYKQNHHGEIQLFYYLEGGQASVYVLDEFGALFHQQLEHLNGQFLLTHFNHLFDLIYLRSQAQREALPISYYEVIGHGAESWHLVQRKLVRQPGLYKARTSLQVIGSFAGEGELELTVFCGQKEFSSLRYGEGIFQQVAEYISNMRQSNQCYPIYVTDLDMPASVLSKEQRKLPTTVHYLAYKKQLEQRFNDALVFAHTQRLSSIA